MIPTFTGLQTALSGLEASQAAIDTTGENISNANTPGYTEQVVNTGEAPGLDIGARDETGAPVQLGTGVDVTSISRVRDQFLDVQYRAQNSVTSAANTNSQELQNVQTAVGTSSSSGLQSDMSAFWTSWSNLATDPTSSAARQTVVNSGQTLASALNAVSSQMNTVMSQAQQQYSTLTGANGQVEQDATQIAALNTQIVQANASGQSPNALLDQRDNLLDSLSGLAQISVTDQSNGSVTVNFGDAATPLIGGATGSTVTWPQTLTSNAGGQLGALLNLSSSTGPVGQYLSSLNNVAGQVVSSVNALQPSSPFFSDTAGSEASTIAVTATPSTVQATSTGSTTAGDLAQAIGNLSGGGADQAYAAFVAQIGNGVQAAENSQTTAQAVLTGISNQRQSVSGVSLDQEMTNLINYQQAYQASARVMNAISSTINTLITTVGGAGL
jgi:flagellar hook-associated protein 1 FlgK